MSNQQPTIDNTLQRSLQFSTIAGVVGMLFFMFVQYGPLPLLLEKLGASGIVIGLTTTAFQIGTLAQIPGALFAERLARRKSFWVVTTMIGRLLVAIPGVYLLLFPEQSKAIICMTLIAISLSSILGQAAGPIWFSWMADLVPDAIRARFWAKRQGLCMIASGISIALIGWFLDLFPETVVAGFGWLLILSAVLGSMDSVLHWFVQEPTPQPANHRLSLTKRILTPLKDHDFRYFTLAMCAWFFGYGFFFTFMNVYLKAEFDISYVHLSVIQLAMMLSGVAASFFSGRMIDQAGGRAYGLALMLATPLFALVWFFLDGNASGLIPIVGVVPQPVMIVGLNMLFAGGVYAGMNMLQLNLLTALAPLEGRTMAMAVYWTFVGLFTALGPIAGGWIKDYITAHPIDITLFADRPFSYFHVIMIVHSLIVLLVVLPLLYRIRKKEGDRPLDQAVMHIFILTPLQSIRNANQYNLFSGSTAINNLKDKLKVTGKKPEVNGKQKLEEEDDGEKTD